MATAVARVSIDATGAKRGASEYDREIGRIKTGTREAHRETERIAQAFRKLAGDLDPAVRAQQSYVKAQKTLAAALRSGVIGQQEYNRQLELATARYGTASRSASQAARQAWGAGASAIGALKSQFLSLAAAYAGARFFQRAIQDAASYQKSLTQITTLVGIHRDQVNAWRDDLRQLSIETGRVPQELAKGLYFVTSAGIPVGEALDVVEASARAAALGMGTVATVADAVTSAVNAYGSGNLSAAHATDILTAAVREGKIEADQLAPVMGTLVPLAAKLGIGFENVAGALAVMSRTGTSASEGATSLQSVMSAMLDSGKEAEKVLSSVGITLADLRGIAAGDGGLVGVMRTLDEAFAGNEDRLAQVVPNIRALRGFMNILAQDAESVDKVMRGVADSTGLVDRAFAELAGDPAFQFEQAKAAAAVFRIELGEALMPAALEVARGLRDMASAASDSTEFKMFAQDVAQSFVLIIQGIGELINWLGELGVQWSTMRSATAEAEGEFVYRVVGSWALLMRAYASMLGPLRQQEAADLRERSKNLLRHAEDLKTSFGETADQVLEEADAARRAARSAAEALREQAQALGEGTGSTESNASATEQLTDAQAKLLDSLRNSAVEESRLAGASEEALRVYRETIAEYGTGEAARAVALRRSDEALRKAKESLEIWNALHKEGVTANAELRAAIIANLSAMQLSERLRKNNEQLLKNEQTLAENAAEAYDDFTDSFEEATAARERLQQAFRTGSEQSLRESAAILAVYAAMPRSQKELEDALFAANLKLEVQRRILAETAKGSGLAAEEIERLTTQELSMARAAEMAAENWEKLTVDLEAIWTEFAEGTQDALVDFLAEGMGSIVDLFADGTFDIEALFDDLWRSVVDAAIQAAAEAAAAWIAAQAASGWATGGTGTGGGTNWASMLGGWGAKMFGGGGGQPSGWDFGPGNVGDTGGGGGGASSVIAWAAVAAIIGAIGYSQGWWGTKGSEARAGATFGGEDLDTIDTWANKSKNLKPVMEKVRAAIEDIRSFVEGVGLEIERFGEVTLQKVRQTYSAQARSATGEILAGVSLAGKSAEEISDALAALAIRTADFGPSVSAFLAAVIHNSDSITTAQLEAEIEMARMIESLGRTDFELRMESIGGRFDAMFEFVARQLADDLEQASAGFGRIVLGEAEEWRAAWRELTGVQLTPEEQLEVMRQNARVFEAEKALRLAELRARIEFLEAEKRITETRARIGLEDLRAQTRIEAGRRRAALAELRFGGAYLGARASLYQAEEDLAVGHFGIMGEIVGAAASILDAEIAALNELIAALEAIPTIDIEGLRLSGGGGGGRRREDQRQLADLLDEFDLSQLGEVEQAFIRLNQQWDEAAELAHGNAELLERVAEARKREIAALEESLREDVFDQVAAFEPLSDVERQLLDITRERTEIEERLRELYQAGIITTEELADAQARLTAAEAQRREEIERGILSEANNLLVDLLEAAGRTEEAAELRWRLEMEAYRLRLLTLEAEYALLNRMEFMVFGPDGGLIYSSAPDFARMWELLGEVLGLGPPVAGAGGGAGGGAVPAGTSEIDRERERAQEILQGFLDLELNPFERDLRDLNETFAELRAVLGDSAEVAHAYELALADLQERYTAGLREFLAELRDPTLNPAETVETLQQRFLDLAATGDLSQSQELAQLGAQLRAAYLSAYGSAGGGFGSLLDLIESTINTFLGGGALPAGLSLPALGAGGGPLGIVPSAGSPAAAIAASVAAPGVELRLDRILAAVERGAQQQHRDLAAGRQEQRQGTQRVAASLRDNRKVRLGAAA